jgi:signal transduction histidine kinase
VAPRSYLSVPISAGGRVFGRLLLGSEGTRPRFDETDLKVAEELGRIMGLTHVNARLVRDLQRAVTARDELLAFLSHDLRNSMAAVRMQAQQLGAEATDGSVRGRLASINGSIDGALRFLGDILDLGRLDAGLFEVQAAPADIGAMVAEALAVNAPAAELRGVRLEPAPAAPGELRCDRQRVVQVLVNLVDNAVKFSPSGGVVRVAVATADGQVCFSVSDEGAGIAERDRPHLFERHYRGAAPSERSGLGLGLFIARRIVEAHRGTIWVESPAGQGATFSFALPSAG